MALFVDDNHIKCTKCSCPELTLQPISVFQLVDTKKGKVLEEEQTGFALTCTRCGATVRKLPVGGFRHIKK